jgi:hypothetical protein
MNSEYIIDDRYYTSLNIWSFIEYNILWSTSEWVFCCFARGSVGASLLNSNLRLACESLQNIWNAKILELSFLFSRSTDRNIEIFQSPFRHFRDLEWPAHSRYSRHKCCLLPNFTLIFYFQISPKEPALLQRRAQNHLVYIVDRNIYWEEEKVGEHKFGSTYQPAAGEL